MIFFPKAMIVEKIVFLQMNAEHNLQRVKLKKLNRKSATHPCLPLKLVSTIFYHFFIFS